MKNKRLHWLDASRGVALSITMFLHILRWTLISFKGWDFTQSSLVNWEVALVRAIEGYLRISWVAPFAFAFVISLRPENYSLKWVSNRFLMLIILPSLVYGTFGFFDVGSFILRWEVIQSLFFYNVIGLLLIDLKARYRYLAYSLMLLATVYLHFHQAEFVDRSLFWNIVAGDLRQNNFFSIISGLPAFFFFYEICILSYNKTTKLLDFKYLKWAGISCFLLMIFLFATGINQLEATHYPPQLVEYLSAFVVSCVVLITTFKYRDKITPRNFLAILGRYCWIHFIGHLTVGAILFDLLKLGRNQLSFIPGVIFASFVLFSLWRMNIYILNKREKKGYDADGK